MFPIDWNIVIGVITILLTIVGFFLLPNVLKNKTKITGNNNKNFNQQGEKNNISHTNIGTQINNHPENKKEITQVSNSVVFAESTSDFFSNIHHKCAQCNWGYKVMPNYTFCSQRLVTCPKCGNVDKIYGI